MKKILVATGTSAHKRDFAVNYIKDYATKKGLDVDVVGANIYEVKIEDVKPDLIVTIGLENFRTSAPVIQGTAFLTKIGMDSVCDLIIAKLI
ncbi:MAG: hypothetical protein N2Z65_02425 [Clostridiales bacterium]|nr:hypothetical protein [Clostridiales bacterium]